MSHTGRLRELIRAVRSCKTASEERALIQKECATIRQAFKEGRESSRSSSMLKLLYITMLGYPTEFGQMEVVKLIAQADYAGKRIGYLTLAVVLDETHEVLTLAENHIKKDLSNSNSFVQAIALDVVANVSGEDMARDVLHEVEILVDSPNMYLRRKACLAALRIVKRAPDHAEIFLEKLLSLFNDRNQAALMCSLTLLNQCLQTEQGQAYLPKFRQLITSAVRVLKQLVLATKITDQDIAGVSDPFLQIKLLEFLRLTGRGSNVASEAMNDVLAQVITNTDASKNVGSAVHYECVKTINSIEADEGLRVLGINTIGRFLSSTKDNNVRFVALATLLRLVPTDVASVQRHHAIVIDCLKDPDLSIRRLALELTVALIDLSSVRILVPDLIQYLQACVPEVQAEVTERIAGVIESKSPSVEWRVEISLRLFKTARSHVPLSFATNFVAFVSQQDADVQKQAAKGLWEELAGPFDASLQNCLALLLAGVWLVAECAGYVIDASRGPRPDDIASCVATITMNTSFHQVKQYGLTALIKVATRFPATKPIAIAVFDSYATNLDCELQQRSCEYTALLESFLEVATFSFSEMPPIEVGLVEEVPKGSSSAVVGATTAAAPQQPVVAVAKQTIDDLFGPAPVVASPTAPVVASTAAPQQHASIVNDLFGPKPTVVASPVAVPPTSAAQPVTAASLFAPAPPAPPVTSAAPPAPSIHDLFGAAPAALVVSPPPIAAVNSLVPPLHQAPAATSQVKPTTIPADIFGAPVASSPAPPVVAAPAAPSASFVAFRNDECNVVMTATFSAPATIHVEAQLHALSSRLQNAAFHIAVPRTSTVELKPVTMSTAAPAGEPVVQRFAVTSSDTSKAQQLLLRVKLVYAVVNGNIAREHLFQVSQELH